MPSVYDLLNSFTAGLCLFAVYVVFRLRPLTAARSGWTLLAASLVLEAVLRLLTLSAASCTWLEWIFQPRVRVGFGFVEALLVCAGVWRMRVQFLTARRSEALYRSVFEGQIDAAFLVSPDGRVADANERAVQLLGYPLRELRGMHVAQLAADATPAEIEVRLAQILAAGEARYERVKRRKDGSSVPCEISARRIDLDGTTLLYAVAHDLTERRRVQSALRESEARYQGLFESISVGVYRSTPDGRIQLANRAFLRILGLERAEDLGTLDLEAESRAAGYERRVFREAVDRDGAVHGMETEWRRRDGARVVCRESARAIRDAAGTLVAYEGTVEDITDRRRLEEQLRQSQKMEAIGQLAGGVAHDFNNLLTVIGGHAALLQRRLANAPAEKEHVDEMARAAARAADLTRQLLAFSRRQVLEPVVLDLPRLIRECESMLRRLIREDIELDLRLDEDVWPVLADRGQMVQVLLNLVVNARDAMPRGGRLTIVARNAHGREAGTLSSVTGAPRPAEAHVVWRVTDTGVGMSADTLRHIFEPFFTTKGVGKGTGLGLSTVYGIVEQSRGSISVSSALGKGTTFEIRLPRCEASAAGDTTTDELTDGLASAGAPEASAAARVAAGARVLLVEDEDSLRCLCSTVLRDAGYEVVAAPDGPSALREAQRLGASLDLLVTDMVMPGIGGRELAARLRREHPRMRVLFVSGYTHDEAFRAGGLPPRSGFLQKPYPPSVLVTRARDLLAARGAPDLAAAS